LYSYTPRGTLSSTSVIGVSTMATKTDAFGQVLYQDYTSTHHRDYDYDALGRLVRAGTSYTGAGNTLALDASTTFVRDPGGGLLGQAGGGTQKLAWTDLHTDLVALFDATSTTLSASAAYDPLGKVLATVGTIGSLGYQSEYIDSATGRINMAARWYNTDTGQFDTRDSVG